jgi:hypothetical protein
MDWKMEDVKIIRSDALERARLPPVGEGRSTTCDFVGSGGCQNVDWYRDSTAERGDWSASPRTSRSGRLCC